MSATRTSPPSAELLAGALDHRRGQIARGHAVAAVKHRHEALARSARHVEQLAPREAMTAQNAIEVRHPLVVAVVGGVTVVERSERLVCREGASIPDLHQLGHIV
jgi:hypothetical protein